MLQHCFLSLTTIALFHYSIPLTTYPFTCFVLNLSSIHSLIVFLFLSIWFRLISFSDVKANERLVQWLQVYFFARSRSPFTGFLYELLIFNLFHHFLFSSSLRFNDNFFQWRTRRWWSWRSTILSFSASWPHLQSSFLLFFFPSLLRTFKHARTRRSDLFPVSASISRTLCKMQLIIVPFRPIGWMKNNLFALLALEMQKTKHKIETMVARRPSLFVKTEILVRL